MSEKVMEVTKVNARKTRTTPPQLTVDADGKVNSGGWTNIRLEPYIYVKPPADGVQEFGMIGDPPTGPSTDPIEDVCAHYNEPCDDWVTGVRVYSANNEQEVSV